MITADELIWELERLPPETILKIRNAEEWLKVCIDFTKKPNKVRKTKRKGKK